MTIADMYRAIGPVPVKENQGPSDLRQKQNEIKPTGPSEFQQILDKTDRADQLNFSKHAEARIKSREIAWDDKLESRVKSGLEAASKKGSREVLILADDVAVIVNVKSRTIVTAMDRATLKEKIFTNIDSTVLV